MKETSLTLEQLKRAVQLREQIDNLQGQLSSLLGNGSAMTNAPATKAGGMSPQARERIAAAQRARWAKVKGQAAPQKNETRPKRTMSAAAKAKIAASARARWKKAKAAGKTTL